MKKKLLFLSLSVLAIAAVVTVKSINTKSGMSSLMTQNIEALTQGEGGGNQPCYRHHYDFGQPGYVLQIRECWSCMIVLAEGCSDPGKC